MNEEEIKKALELTCFHSLSFCCGLRKSCSMRDKARELLGISDKEYIRLKKEFDEKIKEIASKK